MVHGEKIDLTTAFRISSWIFPMGKKKNSGVYFPVQNSQAFLTSQLLTYFVARLQIKMRTGIYLYTFYKLKKRKQKKKYCSVFYIARNLAWFSFRCIINRKKNPKNFTNTYGTSKIFLSVCERTANKSQSIQKSKMN